MSDQPMRDFAANAPMPEMGETPFTPLTKALSECRVAIVTTAALHTPDAEGFTPDDVSFRVLPADRRDLVLGHWSPNFDRSGFVADLDVVYPIDRLDELAADGTIGSVAAHHYSFAGNQEDTLAGIRLDTGPAVARRLRDEDVDVVLLTPV
ncbi:MAG: glycine/sarcosine/betaine reductase selenoprotein B family protein [Actinomycetota bacterium]